MQSTDTNQSQATAPVHVNGGDDLLVFRGDAVKALDDGGKVGGYLVRFGSADQKDMDGDYFTRDTYLGPRDGDGAECLFHHSRPVVKGLEGLADRTFSPIKTRRDEIGVWAETVLDLADEYEKAVHEMVKAGKVGWSSGSASHRVRKSADGRIKCWPICEGSLTPIPAEPRNRGGIRPIKSLETLVLPGHDCGLPQAGREGSKTMTTTDASAGGTLVPAADSGADKEPEKKVKSGPQEVPTKSVGDRPLGHDVLDYVADSLAVMVQYVEECISKIEPGADVLGTLRGLADSFADQHADVQRLIVEHYVAPEGETAEGEEAGEEVGEEAVEQGEVKEPEEAEEEAEKAEQEHGADEPTRFTDEQDGAKDEGGEMDFTKLEEEYARLPPAEKAEADRLLAEIARNQKALGARRAVMDNHARRLREAHGLRCGA